jgi:hypothetical protein
VIVEVYKASIDYAKHLTTLCTGLIVILAAFVEKVFSTPIWKALVAVSIVGFTISILCGVFVHRTLAHSMAAGGKPVPGTDLAGKALVWMLFWFAIGILSLAVFAVRNLYR